MTLPRVLIIGQPFNNDTGGGITLSNLFNGWDRDKLAVACSGYLLLDNIDTKVCNTYYQLGHKEHKWLFPFNYLQRKYSSGQLKFDRKRIQNLSITKSKLRVKLIMNYFIPFLKFIGLSHIISKTELSPEFCNWVNAYNPDILYMQATSRSAVLFCIAVHNYLKKPLIFHMMDDWPSSISTTGLFKKYWQNKIDHEFRTLLEKASILLSISDYMSIEYKNRYGKNFIAFHNPIDIEFWKKYQKKDYRLESSLKILYAGKTSLGVITSLETIARAIQSINEKLNISIKLNLQIKEDPKWITKYHCVERTSFVPYRELPRVFSEADFLILPYDFTRESIKYVQFSMPTKASEFMISGTPIIIFAPGVTAIAKNAKEYNWAKLVTINSVNELSKAIVELIQDKEERQRIAQNAKRIAEDKFNSVKVTHDFRTLICSLQKDH
jgi:glycosyltransferase involved in cell wall biosynthesis